MSRQSGSRPKKRKQGFKKGNTFASSKVRIIEDRSNEDECDNQEPGPSSSNVNNNNSNSSTTTTSADLPRTPKAADRNLPKSTPPSRSKVKLLNLYADIDDSSDDECRPSDSASASLVTDTQGKGYRLIDLDILTSQIEKDLICRHCRATTKLVEDKRHRLGSVFRFDCKNSFCNQNKQFHSDPTVKVKGSGLLNHSVNRQAALAMRYIGCGHSALKHFCGIMDLPPPVTDKSFADIKSSLHDAVVHVQSESMKDAAKIEYALATVTQHDDGTNDEETSPRNIDASIDGSYLTKGFSSKIGVVTAIGCVTGKALDTETKSKL